MDKVVYDLKELTAKQLGEALIHLTVFPLEKFKGASFINEDLFYEILASKNEEERKTLEYYNMLTDVILTLERKFKEECYKAHSLLEFFLIFSVGAHIAEEHNLIVSNATLHKEIDFDFSYIYHHELLNFSNDRYLTKQREAVIANVTHYTKAIKTLVNYNVFIERVAVKLNLLELLGLKHDEELVFLLDKIESYNESINHLKNLVNRFPSDTEEEIKTKELKLKAIEDVFPQLYSIEDAEKDISTMVKKIRKVLNSEAPVAQMKKSLTDLVTNE